jgi:hypothetical protein
MSTLINPPFPTYTETDGTPLEAGFIYVGEEGLEPETNPINTFWDKDLTDSTALPIRTIGGYPSRNGSPAAIFVSETSYSIKVLNKNRVIIYSSLFETNETLEAIQNLTVENIAALKAYDISLLSDNQSVFVNGYYAAGDGGGGRFLWDSTSVVAENDGTVIQITGEATGRFIRPYSLETSVREWGATGDGVTDDSAAFQAAIDWMNNQVLGTGGIVNADIGIYNWGATGITLYEGIQLIGGGMPSLVSSAPAGGTWFLYTGVGKAVTIDGEWTGFIPRRNIKLSNFGIEVQTGATVGLDADFMTIFDMDRVLITGNAAIGVKMVNCFGGSVRNCKFVGADINLDISIKAAPNDVFSGQTLFDNCDFFDATDKDIHIIGDVNVLAQVEFNKCHFKTGAYGAYLEGGNLHKVTFIAPHFEENTTNDLYVHSDVVRGPVVIGGYFNNTNTVYKVNCLGDNIALQSNEIAGGGTGWGVNLAGESAHVFDNFFQGNANSLVIDAAATFTKIGKNDFNAEVGNRITNNGASTEYEGEITIISKIFDLSGATEVDAIFVADKDYWVTDAKIIYTQASSADAGVDILGGITADQDKFFTYTSEINQPLFAVKTPTLETTRFVASGNIISATSLGGKTGTGEVRVNIKLLPFNII